MTAPALAVYGLTCEYLTDPMTVEAAVPRLSWKLASEQRGAAQSAYRILAAGSAQLLGEETADLWDSGRVDSACSVNILYGGRPLGSGAECHWRVQVWDEAGVPGAFSPPAHFEMGLLSTEDWQGPWMGFPAGHSGGALYLRKAFTLAQKPTKARAYIAGLGYYELRLNGARVGDSVLDPAVTDTTKRVLYAGYDVTAQLREGDNAVGIVLGGGWHGMPKARLQLNITLADGTVQRVTSDPYTGWDAAGGPEVCSSIYDGETYDARLELPGWDMPGYSAGDEQPRRWIRAMAVAPPQGRLQAQQMEPVRVVEELTAVAVQQVAPNAWVADFGRNLAGWVRIRVAGPPGTVIKLRYAETLYPDGTVNQENLRTARCTDVFITAGTGDETWQPRFTYHGFRYVQLEDWPGVPESASVTAMVVRTAAAQVGTFACGVPLLNRLHQAIVNTEASNLHGIPTDCPQRDERLGWLNDATVRAEQALYNFGLSRLYAKWLGDIRDTQHPKSGAIADTAPYHWGRCPADPVAACFLLVPWLMYLHCGDTGVLRENYDAMRRWVDFLRGCAKDHIVEYSHYGDWAPPAAQADAGSESGAVSANTPGSMVSTGYYYLSVRLLAKISAVLGNGAERISYDALADDIAVAYNDHFFDPSDDRYGGKNQASDALALYLGLAPGQRRAAVAANLARDVAQSGFHPTTGNQCTKYLPEVLAETGYEDAALALLTQTGYPSWGYMLENGATTIWERWENATGSAMNSHNHPMLGSVGCWFYKHLVGLRPLEDGPGYAHFEVAPCLPRGVEYAGARVETVRGTVEAEWRLCGDTLALALRVPVGSRASVGIKATLFGARLTAVTECDTALWPVPAGDAPTGIAVEGSRDGRQWLALASGSYSLACRYAGPFSSAAGKGSA